ncbi:unnamed protein product [Sphenostylis stenocarpa]|uniref:Uncharacterized protein n=1 Tax=Sphenostylis stenocarpa TaxID=92480 RepID=A0AA86VB87_9FABA|nr:unnamed protein product [Sphenostylis stenocarpa]
MSVSNAFSIPPRPPRRANIGFETIVNRKLERNELRKRPEKKQSVGGSVRICSKIFPPKAGVGFDTIVNEKLQRSTRRDGKLGKQRYKRKETSEGKVLHRKGD